jgi:hypothetical protein
VIITENTNRKNNPAEVFGTLATPLISMLKLVVESPWLTDDMLICIPQIPGLWNVKLASYICG